MSSQHDVIIIGSGPAGLGAARALKDAGVRDVLLIERESEAGGVPRHCRHPTFGLQTFFRPMNGNRWVEKILAPVASAFPVATSTSVVAIKPGGVIDVSSDQGISTLSAKRIILATGVRETPRHARLVSGVRPQGVLTAGALQQFIYLRKLKPGCRPVIIGTELVSFSALWTLRNAGIHAVAMIEEHHRPTAFRFCTLFARLMRVPLRFDAHLARINGRERVESVEISGKDGRLTTLECDSVIFTGGFTGEYTLIRNSPLRQEPASGRPVFDQFGRCSDPAYYAVGNMLHPADMGDQCYQEGLRVGKSVADSLLSAAAHDAFSVPVGHDDIFRMVAPNIIRAGENRQPVTLNIRVRQPFSGHIVVRDGERELYRRRHRCLPERRILLKGIDISALTESSMLTLSAE